MEFKENKENGTEYSCTVLPGDEAVKPVVQAVAVESHVTAMRKKLELAAVSSSQENVKAIGKRFEQQAAAAAASSSSSQVKAIRNKFEWKMATTNACNSQQVKAMRKKLEQDTVVSKQKVKAVRKTFEQKEAVSQEKVAARKRRKIEAEGKHNM